MINEIELTDSLGVQDCRAWLNRALDNKDRVYGRSLCDQAVEGVDIDDADTIDDLKGELAAEEDFAAKLSAGLEVARTAIDKLTAKMNPDGDQALIEALDEIAEALDEANAR